MLILYCGGGRRTRSEATESAVGAVYDDGLLRITWHDSTGALLVEGEVDANSRAGLAAALTAGMWGSGDLVVDLSGLTFIDVEGVRMFVRTARALRQGRMLVLRRVPAPAYRLLLLADWDKTPGLRVEPDPTAARDQL